MTRFAIELSDRLVRADRALRFEERRGDLLDFRDDRNGQRLTLTDKELAEMVADGEATLVRKERPDIRAELVTKRGKDFSLQPAELRQEARRRLAYVEAARLRSAMPDEEMKKIVATTAGRIEDATPPSVRSLRRWLRTAGQAPVASALVPAIAARGNRTDRLDLRVREIIEAKIDAIHMARPPVAITTLLDHVRVAVNDANETLPVKLACPSYTTVKRAVEARPPRDMMAARFGEAAAAQKYDGVITRKGPLRPLELCELDHTSNDLFVLCGRTGLPIGRATIAFVDDRCTRMPCGVYIGFDPPSVHTVMQCLRNAMLPKTYVERKVRDGEWKIDNRWEVSGKPKTILLDRAMENLSGDLEDFAAEAGIHLMFAPRKMGKYKGGIERFLKTLNRDLMHEQRGTSFGNIIDRNDYDPAKNAVVTYDYLVHVVHRYILDVYACRPHKGSRRIPAEHYKEMVEKYPVQPIEDVQKLNMLFGRTETRMLQRTGILFEYIIYFSEELVALIADPEFLKLSPDRSIKFRYDPADLEFARVYDPVREAYIKVPACERDSDYVKGLSIWQHRHIVKHWNKRLKEDTDYGAISRAKVEIRELFEQAWKGKAKLGSRIRAARHDGLGRLSMAGADEATSPAGSVDHAHRAVSATKNASGIKAPAVRVMPASSSAVATDRKAVDATVSPIKAPISSSEDLYAEIGILRGG